MKSRVAETVTKKARSDQPGSRACACELLYEAGRQVGQRGLGRKGASPLALRARRVSRDGSCDVHREPERTRRSFQHPVLHVRG